MLPISPSKRTLEGWQKALDAANVNAELEGIRPAPELADLDRQLYNLEIQPEEYLARAVEILLDSKYAHEGKCS